MHFVNRKRISQLSKCIIVAESTSLLFFFDFFFLFRILHTDSYNTVLLKFAPKTDKIAKSDCKIQLLFKVYGACNNMKKLTAKNKRMLVSERSPECSDCLLRFTEQQ